MGRKKMVPDAAPLANETRRTTPWAVPYASTALRALWVPSALAAASGDVLFSAIPGGTTGNPPEALYRVTPAVYAWFRERLAAAEDQVFAGTGTITAEQLAEAARRWRPIAEWAEAVYPAAELAAAEAGLPKVPRDLAAQVAAVGRQAAACEARAGRFAAWLEELAS